MRQHMIELSRDWISLALLGLGISLSPHEFFGGLFLALAAGSVVARHRKSTRKILGIMGSAAMMAVLAVLVTQHYDHWGYEPQLIMAAAGAASSWTVNIFVRVMDETQARSGSIVGQVIERFLGGGK